MNDENTQVYLVKLDGNSVVKIKLSKKQAEDLGFGKGFLINKKPDHGLMTGLQEDDELAPRNELGITFYDMGVKWDGDEWVDNSFSADIGFTYNGTNAPADITGFPTADDEEDKALALLTPAISEFPETYRKITKDEWANFYQLMIRSDAGDQIINYESPYWAQDGQSVVGFPHEGLIRIRRNSSFWPTMYLGVGSGANLITTTPIRTGDPYVYTPEDGDEIYLAPVFCAPTIYASGFVSYPHDRPEIFDHPSLGYTFAQQVIVDHLTFPRIALEDAVEAFHEYTVSEDFFFIGAYGHPRFNADSYAAWWLAQEYAKTLNETVYQQMIGYDYDIETEEVTEQKYYELLPDASFPRADIYPAPPTVPTSIPAGYPIEIQSLWPTRTRPETLLAVIIKNGTPYYVWED